MPNPSKYNQILDALQELLENQELPSISVSEIAHTAGSVRGVSIIIFLPKMRFSRLW